MVRRFFRINGFNFLSTSSNGEKLYYTIGGNTLNNKQPDSIVTKENIIIICEDKILFKKLFSEQNYSIDDYTKLSGFLNSKVDLDLFRNKLSKLNFPPNIIIVGCLSSLVGNTSGQPSFVGESLLNISIEELKNDKFKMTLYSIDSYKKYFNQFELEITV